jgi:hypothetical protein
VVPQIAATSVNFYSGIFDRKEELIDLAKLSSMAAPVSSESLLNSTISSISRFTSGYTIKGMIPVIETANDILKAAIKKESFEPTQNLRKITHGIRMLAASYAQLNQYRKDNFKPILTG